MLISLNVKTSVNVWLLEIGSSPSPLASFMPISVSSLTAALAPRRRRKRCRIRSGSPSRKKVSFRTRMSPERVSFFTQSGRAGATEGSARLSETSFSLRTPFCLRISSRSLALLSPPSTPRKMITNHITTVCIRLAPSLSRFHSRLAPALRRWRSTGWQAPRAGGRSAGRKWKHR